MRHVVSCMLAVSMLASLSLRAHADPQDLSASPAVTTWATQNAKPLGLQSVRQVVGAARVIGLGEAQHGVAEFLELRNQLTEFAVTKMNVTAIAAETGYNESIAVDDFLQGKGELTPALVSSVFSWADPVAYSANRKLLQWLRDYNLRSTTTRRVHFYGIDLTGGRGGRFTQARDALDAALSYVGAVDPADAGTFRSRFDPLEPKFASGSYDSLTGDQQQALTSAIDDLIALFGRRAVLWTNATSTDAFERAYRSAMIASQLNANFRAAGPESNPQAQREAAMSQNLQWALQREGPGGRILLYEANWHISKGPMMTDKFGSSLGEFLQRDLKQNYVSIGTSFGAKQGDESSAPDRTSIAAVLSRACHSACLLDLRHVPAGNVSEFMNVLRPIQGGRPDMVLASRAFDAVIFFPTVQGAEQL